MLIIFGHKILYKLVFFTSVFHLFLGLENSLDLKKNQLKMLKNYVYCSKSNMTILKLLNEILFHTLINKNLQKVC